MLNPLGSIIAGGSGKIGSDFTGYLTNAAQSSGDAQSNARAFYDKMGINKEMAQQILNELVSKNKLSAADRQAYEGGLNTVFGGAPLAAPKTQSMTMSIPKNQKQPLLDRTNQVNDKVGRTSMAGAGNNTRANKMQSQGFLVGNANPKTAPVTKSTFPKKNRTGKVASVY